jgi:histidine triad (HIT) family protein
MVDPCPFCERARDPSAVLGGVLLENSQFLATLWAEGAGPTYLGQVVVQTRRHVPTLAELTPSEGVAIGPFLQRLASALGEAVRPELVYLDCYMEVVRHVHLFLTPRYPGTPREYWRLGVVDWPEAPRGDRAEVEALAERIRSALRRRAAAARTGPTRPGRGTRRVVETRHTARRPHGRRPHRE